MPEPASAPTSSDASRLQIRLRKVIPADLPIFFAHQLDPEANYMAAFTAKDPADRAGFETRWAKILANPGIVVRTILVDEKVAGHILKHSSFGFPEVSYWIGKEYWGMGVAAQALSLFLEEIAAGPLYGRAAADNIASIRVLQKCGFSISGREKGYSNARGREIEEVILKLPPKS